MAVALDAQRQEVFAAVYGPQTQRGRMPIDAERIIALPAWLESLTGDVWVSGPVLEKLAAELPPGVRPLAREFWYPRAATVGRLAGEVFDRGEHDDLWQLVPKYLRRSAAEEKWESKAESGKRKAES